jgi:hypothetical protein
MDKETHMPSTEVLAGSEVELLARIARLEDEVASMRSELERSPVVGSAGSSTSSETTSGLIAAVQRDAILTVMAEERERMATERETEREQREMQALLDRTSRLAETLGLGSGDEKKLVDLMLADRENRESLLEEMRDLRGQPDSRETIRENWQAYQEDRRADLASAFGTDLAEQILEMERPRDRRSGGGGGDVGRGQRPDAGPGGGGNANGRGQGRRGRDL